MKRIFSEMKENHFTCLDLKDVRQNGNILIRYVRRPVVAFCAEDYIGVQFLNTVSVDSVRGGESVFPFG